ncbi:MAG: hypothetical protein LBL04_06440 [Bacteroidales bacterium]|nr:hypothetical protein [Bacteroidales bacterium]
MPRLYATLTVVDRPCQRWWSLIDPVSRDVACHVSTTQPDRSALRTGVGAAPDLTGSTDLSGSKPQLN